MKTALFCIMLVVLVRVVYFYGFDDVAFPLKNKTSLYGKIVSLPACSRSHCKFVFETLVKTSRHVRLLVSWYGAHPRLSAGSTWRLPLRMKSRQSVHSHYRIWLMAHSLDGVAYVDHFRRSIMIDPSSSYSILHMREFVQNFITSAVHDHSLSSILAALTVGSRAFMTPPEWRVFQRTGTAHLIAISGLHIAFVAMAFYRLACCCVSFFPSLIDFYPAPMWGGCFALLSSWLYSSLAGWSYSTERAFIMIASCYVPVFFQINVFFWYRLLLAFLLISISSPEALLQAGFWLSFAAVSIIGYVSRARLSHLSTWRTNIKLHLYISLGLLPVTLFFFHQSSVIEVFTNLIAVPWVSFLVIPISLFACVVLLVSSKIAAILFHCAALMLEPLWYLLRDVSSWQHAVVQFSLSSSALLLCELCVLVFLLPVFSELRCLFFALYLLELAHR